MALVITGANAKIRYNGDLFAFASGVSVDHEDRLEEIPQLDSLQVAEYAENGHRCTITVNFFKLAPDAVDASGNPIANNASGLGLDDLSDLRVLLLQPLGLIEIVADDAAGQERTIYVGHGAKFQGGNGTCDSRGVWAGSFIWKCLRGVGI